MTTATISPLDLVSSGRRARKAAAAAFRRRVRLPPRYTLSEWADKYRYVSPPSAEVGPWRTDRVPYLREIMDTISGRQHTDITVVKSSQSAGTEALNNAVGFYIDQEPSSMLMIQPNVKPMAQTWSKDRLAPMLRDSVKLRNKVREPRSRDSGNTVEHKIFPGGYISIIGANSAAGLASRPIRIVLADELDRWGASAGTEGDPLALAEARTITFRHRKKIVKVSTPGNAGESRIEKEWEISDQRHYYVPCPHCHHKQPLEWRASNGSPGILAGRGEYCLVWEKEQVGEDVVHRPETAAYVCRECRALIQETSKPWMLANGEWVKHNPSSNRAGFHISGLLSPWVRWRDIASDWLRKKDDPEQRKTFFNTLLGLLYAESGEAPDSGELEGRREAYRAEVPRGVGLLTAGVDVQGDRIELEIRGWGDREESWQIRLERIYGDPDGDEVWEQAEELLVRGWRHESGRELRVQVCMVDSGFKTDRVYAFVRPRQLRRVYAAKGNDNAKEPLSRASKANRDGVKVFTYNPVKFKDTLFSRLKRAVPGAGYLHFGPRETTGADRAYFEQFGAEKRLVEFDRHRGQIVVRYTNVTKQRNEAIDLYVLNLVALRSLNLATRAKVATMAAEMDAEPDEPVPESRNPSPHPVDFRRPHDDFRPPRTGWATGWRPRR